MEQIQSKLRRKLAALLNECVVEYQASTLRLLDDITKSDVAETRRIVNRPTHYSPAPNVAVTPGKIDLFQPLPVRDH